MHILRSSLWLTTGVAILGVFSGAAVGATAQDDDPALEPQIVASGTAEVVIPATRASLSVEITSRAATAAAASAESARLSRAVSGALQSAGLSREEIAESRLFVGPRWEYDRAAQRQKRTGYEATTTVQIETQHLDRLGSYIDAALNAGATGISDITFSAKDSEEARRRALTEAVSRARTDAETIARAGGGMLGSLLLLTTEPQSVPRPFGQAVVSAAAIASVPQSIGTELVPSQIKVTAEVIGRWKFVPGAASP